MNDYEQYKTFLNKAHINFKESNDSDYFYLAYEDSGDSEVIMVAEFRLSDKSICGIYLADAISSIEDFL